MSTSNVPDWPRDVCSTGQREAAVSVDGKDRREIMLVRVKVEKIEHIKTIKLQHFCAGLAHHGGQLYITTNTALHVYDMADGKGMKMYSDGRKVGINVNKCAVSPDGCRIYITSTTHNQLITLNKDGTMLSTLTHPELQCPITPHVTAQGHVFVTCYDRGTVVQVTENNNHQTVTTLAGENNGLTKPVSLCFNSNYSLVVGLLNNNNIVELKLK